MSVVVLLSRQRSGTGALASVLERHPDIYYCGEILDHGCDKTSFFGWLAAHGHVARSPLDYSALFEEFVTALLAEDRINLIDIKYNSLQVIPAQFRSFEEVPWVLDYLSRLPVPMINLRRNPLQTYVSAKLAERHGAFHVVHGSAVSAGKIALDLQDFAAFHFFALKENQAIATFFDDYGFSTVLDYERCFEPDGTLSPQALEQVGRLLDLDFSALDRTPRFRKQSAESIVDKVENLEEVIQTLGALAA